MKITIYTSETCPHCMALKKYLKENKIKYADKDVADQKNAQESIEKSGGMAVPIIDIDGKIIVGFDREKLEKILK